MQAWNWALSLRAAGTRCRMFVHHAPGALTQEQRGLFERIGARLIETTPFGIGKAAHCNKIRQLESGALFDTDFVILSDADLAFVRDPFEHVEPGAVKAKPVDLPNPMEAVWRKLFDLAGLGEEVETVPLELAPEARTFSTNLNGGLYVFPTDLAAEIAPLWRRYAEFCLGQEEILRRQAHHSDQIGMGMALLDLGAPLTRLPSGANLPTHLKPEVLRRIPEQEVSALHYHARMDNHGLPERTGIGWIDAAVVDVRDRIEGLRRQYFSNATFWDFRYARFPELGSGLGSRGDALAYKRRILGDLFAARPQGAVLDVGCGDLEVTSHLCIEDYLGLDISAEATALASAKRPDWKFTVGDLNAVAGRSFDYVLCMDVFIHQPSRAAAAELLDGLIRAANRELVLTVHSEESGRSRISFDSAWLRAALEAHPDVASCVALGAYRDVTILQASKKARRCG